MASGHIAYVKVTPFSVTEKGGATKPTSASAPQVILYKFDDGRLGWKGLRGSMFYIGGEAARSLWGILSRGHGIDGWPATFYDQTNTSPTIYSTSNGATTTAGGVTLGTANMV